MGNGVTVASVEKVSPFSSVFLYVRGGSRAEAYSQQGLAHFMSICAPLVCSFAFVSPIQGSVALFGLLTMHY